MKKAVGERIREDACREAVIRGRKGEGVMVCDTTCNLLMSCSTFSIQCFVSGCSLAAKALDM